MGLSGSPHDEDLSESSSDLEEGEINERELPLPLQKPEPRIPPPTSTGRIRVEPSPVMAKRPNYLQESSFDQLPRRHFREYQRSPTLVQPPPVYPPVPSFPGLHAYSLPLC